jgi:energy-coupling factor transporter ATP-binding protein EcfA2
MTRAEISRKFDDIVSFAEVERFLDTPVKRYSSGMYVRLAFAVAANLEPEILVVDEVLAVGDSEFHKKCLGKMHEVSRGGRTVLFVSHNMAAIQRLCSRALWINRGGLCFDGAVVEGVGRYLAGSLAGPQVGVESPVALTPGLSLQRFEIVPHTIASGDRLEFNVSVAASERTVLRHLTLLIYSLQETRVAIIDLRSAGFPRTIGAGKTSTVSGWIERLPLVEGEYRVGVGFSTDDHFEDRLGLVDINVKPRLSTEGLVPYEAQYRGVVDLDFGIHASSL